MPRKQGTRRSHEKIYQRISTFSAAQPAEIPGFGKSGKMCQPKKIFPPPELPRDFRPVHKMASHSQPGTSGQAPPVPGSASQQDGRRERLDANKRSAVLGETPHFSELVLPHWDSNKNGPVRTVWSDALNTFVPWWVMNQTVKALRRICGNVGEERIAVCQRSC